MADTIPSEKDASTMKAEANQVTSVAKESSAGCNGTTNGNSAKDQDQQPKTDNVTAASPDAEPIAGPSSGESKSM